MMIKSVKNNTLELVIKKSRFICVLRHIDSVKDIPYVLKEIKNKYKNASHYCYAYKCNGLMKSSDDKEPSGTAGIPILEVLNKNEIDYVIAVVVRYFGGIKLGSGGLMRAYSRVCRECLKSCIIMLESGYNMTITLEYQDLKKLNYILNNFKCKNIKRSFLDNIIYNLDGSKELYEVLIKNNYHIVINKDIYL